MLKKLLLVAVSTSSLIMSQAAFAEDGDTGTLAVSLTVESGCELAVGTAPGTENGGTAAGTLGFGTVTVFGAGGQNPVDGDVTAEAGTVTAGDANTFTINCGTGATPAITPSITLNNGLNEDAGQRFLINGTTKIAYDLFQDAARTNAFVAGTPVPLTLTAGRVAVPIYGLAKSVAATGTVDGTYNDTVTLTLTY